MYVKETTPQNTDELSSYLERETDKLEVELQNPEVESIQFTIHNVEPDKPRTGALYYADGTNWNPLAGGEGFYYYTSGAVWVKLG